MRRAGVLVAFLVLLASCESDQLGRPELPAEEPPPIDVAEAIVDPVIEEVPSVDPIVRAPDPDPEPDPEPEPDPDPEPEPDPEPPADFLSGRLLLHGHKNYVPSSETSFWVEGAFKLDGIVPISDFDQIPLDTCFEHQRFLLDVAGLVSVGEMIELLGPVASFGFPTTRGPNNAYNGSVWLTMLGGPVDVALSGSALLPATSIPGRLTVPADVAFTNLPDDDSIHLNLGQPYRLSFVPGGSDEVVLTFFGNFMGMVTCRMIDDGEFEIPDWVPARVPDSGTGVCLERHNFELYEDQNAKILLQSALITSVPLYVHP
jgi:hypothetical protein